MPSDKAIHFGRFVRNLRLEIGLSLKEFGEKIGITEKRAWDIEQMAEPQVNDRTLYGIARAVGMTVDALERNWKETPMAQRKLRKGAKRRVIKLDAETYAIIDAAAAAHGMPIERYIAELVSTAPAGSSPSASPDPPEVTLEPGILGQRKPPPPPPKPPAPARSGKAAKVRARSGK